MFVSHSAVIAARALRRQAVFVLFALLGTASAAHATTATWNANTEPDIAGYVLSYGTQPGQHPVATDVGNVTTWQINGLTPGQRYYFVVQAYNTASQFSAPSAEAIFDMPGGTNQPPVLTQPAAQTSTENSAISLSLVASDPNGTALTYSATGLPPSLSVNSSTGVISGTLTFSSAGTYSVTATVSDGSLTNSKTFAWTVTNVNRAPVLTQPAAQTSAEKATVSLSLSASDPDGTALTYSATGLPASLSVNSSTGVIAGTLTATSAGTYSVTATVSDGTLTNSKTFTWTVTHVVSVSITSLSPTSATVGSNITITGTGFGTTQGASTVKFNGRLATPASWGATSIVVPVPAGTTAGPVVVTVGGVSSNGVTFTPTPTAVSGLRIIP